MGNNFQIGNVETYNTCLNKQGEGQIDMQVNIDKDMDRYSYSLLYKHISYAQKYSDSIRNLPVSSSWSGKGGVNLCPQSPQECLSTLEQASFFPFGELSLSLLCLTLPIWGKLIPDLLPERLMTRTVCTNLDIHQGKWLFPQVVGKQGEPVKS